jgi:hypothetical protein
MSAILNLYLTRKNGKTFPFYKCTALSRGEKDEMSGEWRNIFKLEDLQTDLSIMYVQPGGSTQKPQTISPIRGGYRLKAGTTFHVNPATDFHTPDHKLVVTGDDLEVCAPDDVLGKELRQSPLSRTHWLFTVLCPDGVSTMVIPAEVLRGDVISPAPPLGYADKNAPDLT